MNTQAAVFRKVHEPLTVESLEIDKPWGREVLVRTAATGVCHSDLPVVVDGTFEVLEGMVQPKSVVTIEFETMEQARKWYASPEYAQTIPLRQRCANTSLILVEGVRRPA